MVSGMESIPDGNAGSIATADRRQPTLKDVAARAGVSVSTVARVLHNQGYVAPETREVVAAALAESGYQLNAVAQGLRKRRTTEIGHILHSISPNPFFAQVALGSEQAAAEHGRTVVLYNTNGEPDAERLGVEALIRRRVEAILFTTVTDPANVELAVAAGIPVVQVERLSGIETHAVTVDNYRGAFEAADHLLALGHRRIACLGVDPASRAQSGPRHRRVVERERLSGFLDAHASHGIEVDDDLVILGESYYDLDAARRAAGCWLALPPAARPTAIFATCDILAAGVLQQAYGDGMRVPADLSLVGFDDTVGDHLSPPLTTVRQPMAELGRTAVRLAMAAIEAGPRAKPLRERLATDLVIRASTGPPR